MRIGDEIRLKIESLNYSPNAVGRYNGFVVFVPLGVPDDELLVKITQVKKNFAIANLIQIISPSKHRCSPPCPHYLQGCGGCQWQHIEYEHQGHWKKDIIIQALQRIGKFKHIPDIQVCINEPFHYRNKLRLFSANRKGKLLFGMKKHNSHKVVPIKECLISNNEINSLSNVFKGEILPSDSHISELGIKTSMGQIMLLCTYSKDNLFVGKEAERLSHISGIRSIFTSTEGGKFRLRYGVDTIEENIGGINYKIGADSFFQVNLQGLANLVEIVKDCIGSENQLILDAHCGIGTFALQIAKSAKMVYGMDISSPAIDLAKINAKENHIDNVNFRIGSMSGLLHELKNKKIDIAILDPPREGCEKPDLTSLIQSDIKKIVYVSCNPTTLARDLNELNKEGYNLERLYMVDMFPMTYHLETVAFCVKS
ncbi:MAG: 23S rRNA (uracil(1939)-C(5))-methyltransferase RlmD [Candidatus Poribacteria bacterium]